MNHHFRFDRSGVKLCVFIYMILGGKRGSNDVKIFLGAIFYISLISTLIYILQEGEFET